jgi:hypothetical protein
MLEVSDQAPNPEIAFECYGVPVRAYSNKEELLARIEPLLPPLRTPMVQPYHEQSRSLGIVVEPDGTHSVYNSATRVSEGINLELALVVLETQIRGWIALWAPNHIFVHAGVVAFDGRAVIFPGDSFSGKTTLVAALVKQGAVYYSDEFAVIGKDGKIYPYPKPLSIRPPDTTGQQTDHTPESLDAKVGDKPLPLSLAVVTYFVPGADWQPRRLSPGEGTLALMSKTIPASYRPKESMEVLTTALQGATVLDGERGEADEFAELLLSGAVA